MARETRMSRNSNLATTLPHKSCSKNVSESKIMKTPTKHKSIDQDADRKSVTPSKKIRSNENTPEKTPSAVVKKLTLASPENSRTFTPKQLFNNSFQSARSNSKVVTPPKQIQSKEITPQKTPSTLLNKLTLASPENARTCTPKQLFQSARKALHSSVPTQLPGREKEVNEVCEFISELVNTKTAGSLYISGPPGTGKTAALSVILEEPQVLQLTKVFVNCTAIKSSRTIFSRITTELSLKVSGKAEKDYVAAINTYLTKTHKMILLVLDEIDQLDSKNQSVLYTIFEWPAQKNSKLILIGIANALDLTDRILPRLQARCELKPKLMHFAPYTQNQIVHIFMERLKESNVSELFPAQAIQLLARKVAAVSGDVRRALDIGRRVVELAEQNGNKLVLQSVENLSKESNAVKLDQVVSVLNNVYGTAQNLDDSHDTFPLQQKLVLCALLLILKKARNKDVTVGKLHEVYKRICKKRNLDAVDQAEFVGLCSLVETRGILRVEGKKETRLHKVTLQWDDEEVMNALKDQQLLSTVLQDVSCLGKL